jgi:hypothetical protein
VEREERDGWNVSLPSTAMKYTYFLSFDIRTPGFVFGQKATGFRLWNSEDEPFEAFQKMKLEILSEVPNGSDLMPLSFCRP